MIIFGKSIHRKYHKYIIIICVLFFSLLLMSCSDRIYFDPKTTAIKYVFKKEINDNELK